MQYKGQSLMVLVVILTMVPKVVMAQVVTDGLVSWWNGEGAGDSIGTNHGILRGGATIGPGCVGNGFVFDVIGEHVEIPDSSGSGLDGMTTATLEAWVNPTSTEPMPILTKYDTTVGLGPRESFYMRILSADEIEGNFYTWAPTDRLSSYTTSFVLDPDAGWYHIVATTDGSRIRLFVNAVEESVIRDGSIGTYTHVRDTSNPVMIGANIAGGCPGVLGCSANRVYAPARASIDEVRLYNRELSRLEVLRNYVGGSCASALVGIRQLIQVVMTLNLQQGISNSLDSKLQAAEQALDDINENNDAAAINALSAFQNAVEAQSGNKIPAADAEVLLGVASSLVTLLQLP